MKLFRNPTRAIYLIVLFLALLLIALASQCRASDLHIEAGSAVVRGYTPAMGFRLSFDNGPKDTDYECSLHLIGDTSVSTNNAALSCLIVDGFGKFDIGFGVTFLHHADHFNGSSENFALMVGYRITDRLSVRVRHASNAGMTDVNLGRDVLLIGWRF